MDITLQSSNCSLNIDRKQSDQHYEINQCELRIYSLFYKNLFYKKHRGSNFQISRISNLISIVKLISVCLFTFLQESILQGSPRLKFPNIKNTLKLKISSTPYPALKMTKPLVEHSPRPFFSVAVLFHIVVSLQGKACMCRKSRVAKQLNISCTRFFL